MKKEKKKCYKIKAKTRNEKEILKVRSWLWISAVLDISKISEPKMKFSQNISLFYNLTKTTLSLFRCETFSVSLSHFLLGVFKVREDMSLYGLHHMSAPQSSRTANPTDPCKREKTRTEKKPYRGISERLNIMINFHI